VLLLLQLQLLLLLTSQTSAQGGLCYDSAPVVVTGHPDGKPEIELLFSFFFFFFFFFFLSILINSLLITIFFNFFCSPYHGSLWYCELHVGCDILRFPGEWGRVPVFGPVPNLEWDDCLWDPHDYWPALCERDCSAPGCSQWYPGLTNQPAIQWKHIWC
jgi:hypothetical protein